VTAPTGHARRDSSPEVAAEADGAQPPRSRLRRLAPPIAALVLGLGATALLSLAVRAVHADNEQRLLRQRTREAAAVLTAAVPSVQIPLGSAAELVRATNGDVATLDRFLSTQVQLGRFSSATMWRLGALTPEVSAGAPTVLADLHPEEIRRRLASAAPGALSVVDLLDAKEPRLGYLFRAADPVSDLIVYTESALPPERRGVVRPGTAFDGLDYALYLGRASRRASCFSRVSPTSPFGACARTRRFPSPTARSSS
jgi:hypothetical protein